MIRVGLNGFGRIGRILTRMITSKRKFELVLINEIDDDVENLAYLLKYDSIYGKFKADIKIKHKSLFLNGKKILIYSRNKIEDVPWRKNKVDIVIDASGTNANVKAAHKVLKTGISKVIITHSPIKNIDFTMIMGVNEKKYQPRKHNVISSSICDASALAPVLSQIEKKWNIESGFVTTLHSRLSYQNLLDGSLRSISSPGHNWKDYSLGRNSMASLIPKKTTAIDAVIRCVPELKDKISGLSFRVPTSIVCCSDLTIKVKKKATTNDVKNFFFNLSKKENKIYEYQKEALVSIDHLGTKKSSIVDSNYIDVIKTNLIKMVVWYDNEWGYSNRVIDILDYITKKKA